MMSKTPAALARKSSRGCLRTLTQTLMRLARRGNVEAIRDYLSSDAFLHAFVGLAPHHRKSVMRTYSKAEVLCEANARHPLAIPKRIDAKRAEKISWADPTTKARLAAAYAVAGDDHEKAARLLNVSIGSARLAKRRHLSMS
jgi:hypothetical protein